MKATCPTSQNLLSFATGKADDETVETVGVHLDSCAACLTKLSQLSAADPLLRKLPQVKVAAGADAAELSRVLNVVAAFRPYASAAEVVDQQQLFSVLRASRLLDEQTLSNLVEGNQRSPAPDCASLLSRLVALDKLTAFQASNLLRGKSKGWILGEYVIENQLGAGGMGLVYAARHRIMNRTVALKVLPPALLASPTSLQRFRREIEAIAKLRHPNLVRAYDAGEAEGIHYLVVEILHGETLGERVRRRGPLSITEAISIATQAAQGLASAHAQGIIHRDIKPDNIWLESDGSPGGKSSGMPQVRILDFGLAYFVGEQLSREDRLTASSTVLGTLAYLAPEQGRDSQQADPRSDIYSLGCTLWYMLTASPPFRGKSPLDTFLLHSQEPLPDLRDKRREVPVELVNLVRRMLAKSPADRPANMNSLLADLAAISSRQSFSKTLGSPHLHDSLRRGATVFSLLLAAGASAYWLSQPRKSTEAIQIPTVFPSAQPEPAPSVRPSPKLNPEPTPPPMISPFSETAARGAQQQWATYLQKPVEYSLPELKLRCVLIPPGEFTMGTAPEVLEQRISEISRNWEAEWLKRNRAFEVPPHLVRISQPFYLSRTEITVGQFRTFVSTTGHRTQAETSTKGGISFAKGLSRRQSSEFNWRQPGYPLRDDLPVTQVSWSDAQAFCRWISEVCEVECGLPTEAQWEYACRGGTTSRWFFGEDRQRLREFASNNSVGEYGPAAVGLSQPNPFGLFDLLGNVREWCEDSFQPELRTQEMRIDPVVVSPTPVSHSMRGGGYVDPGVGQTPTSRQGNPTSDPCNDHLGFRIMIRVSKAP